MMRRATSVRLLAVIAIAIGLAGCSSDNTDKLSLPRPGESGSDSEGPAGHTHSAADVEQAQAELDKLSPEDAATAKKQHVCPVTGELLGSMGPPKSVDVNGQEVWICCEGCRDQLLANPDEYLAKIGMK